MRSMVGTALLLLPLTSLATAVHFSGWHGPSYRGPEIENSQPLSLNDCYTLIDGDFDNPLASIRASGLQDTNAVGGDYIELYGRSECRNWKSRVKWSGFCMGVVFRSARYIPPSPRNESVVNVSNIRALNCGLSHAAGPRSSAYGGGNCCEGRAEACR